MKARKKSFHIFPDWGNVIEHDARSDYRYFVARTYAMLRYDRGYWYGHMLIQTSWIPKDKDLGDELVVWDAKNIPI